MLRRGKALSALLSHFANTRTKYVVRAAALVAVKPSAAWKYLRPFTLCSLSLVAVSPLPKGSSSLSTQQLAQILQNADDLYNENKYDEVLKLLRPYKDIGNEEVFWRISRAAFTLSQSSGINKHEKSALVVESFEMAKLTLEVNEENALGHKWMACVLDSYNALQGFRAQCTSIELIRKHLEISMKLNPKDATVIYILGMWYFGMAEIKWYERKLMNAILGKDVPATYNEALTYFKMAEEISPNFYSLNLLMLGKCHLKLGDKDTALIYLKRAANYPQSTEDDHKARKEASELLKTIQGS